MVDLLYRTCFDQIMMCFLPSFCRLSSYTDDGGITGICFLTLRCFALFVDSIVSLLELAMVKMVLLVCLLEMEYSQLFACFHVCLLEMKMKALQVLVCL